MPGLGDGLGDGDMDEDELWDPDVPPPAVVPVPVTEVTDPGDLVGRRVVVGTPGIGFRDDVRALGLDRDGSVEVLAEHDYFRQRVTGVRLPRLRWPADRVWLERRLPAGRPVRPTGFDAELDRLLAGDPTAGAPTRGASTGGGPTGGGPTGGGPAGGAAGPGSGEGVVDPGGRVPGGPPIRRPSRVTASSRVAGRRAVVSSARGFHPGLRVVSEPAPHGVDGEVLVTLLTEEDWYRWAIQQDPRLSFRGVPIYHVWVE